MKFVTLERRTEIWNFLFSLLFAASSWCCGRNGRSSIIECRCGNDVWTFPCWLLVLFWPSTTSFILHICCRVERSVRVASNTLHPPAILDHDEERKKLLKFDDDVNSFIFGKSMTETSHVFQKFHQSVSIVDLVSTIKANNTRDTAPHHSSASPSDLKVDEGIAKELHWCFHPPHVPQPQHLCILQNINEINQLWACFCCRENGWKGAKLNQNRRLKLISSGANHGKEMGQERFWEAFASPAKAEIQLRFFEQGSHSTRFWWTAMRVNFILGLLPVEHVTAKSSLYQTHRDAPLHLDAQVNKIQIISASNLKQAGFHCELCDFSAKDNLTFLDHMNSIRRTFTPPPPLLILASSL